MIKPIIPIIIVRQGTVLTIETNKKPFKIIGNGIPPREVSTQIW